MYLRRLVRDGQCEVNGRNENVGYRLRANDFIEIDVDVTRENSMRPQDIRIEILFEDEHLAVVNKPPGMLVHPTNIDKTGTLLNALAYHFNHRNGAERTEAIRPGLIHRLDKETSGVMVIAKTDRAHRSLSAQFQRRYVDKRYIAVVEGVMNDRAGTIELPIGRYAEEKRWDIKPDGKPAETKFNVQDQYPDRTLVELVPVTGRTNQLRIHCAAIGHPIVGDVSRGGREFSRLCLHAFSLEIRHPITRQDLKFTAEMPGSFTEAVSANGRT
ncbi:MAG: RluA family pseudouridine synthase [Pyrinomonadaceae bacterium]|nr:RluA family pseudouridine synthase [Pyrinomonadaceae bacterium]